LENFVRKLPVVKPQKKYKIMNYVRLRTQKFHSVRRLKALGKEKVIY